MKYCIYDCCRDKKKIQELKSKGLYVYYLRLGDNGEIATIEPYALINECGNIITNEPIIFTNGLSNFHDEDNYEDFEEFCSNNEEVEELEELTCEGVYHEV